MLKRCVGITKESIDVLKEYYKKDFDFIALDYQKFQRSFCLKCGAVNNGLIKICDCKSKNHKTFKNYSNHNKEYDNIYYSESKDKSFIIYNKKLLIEENELSLMEFKTKNEVIVDWQEKDHLIANYINSESEKLLKNFYLYKDVKEIHDYIKLSYSEIFELLFHQKDLIYEDLFWKYPTVTYSLIHAITIPKLEKKIKYDELLDNFKLNKKDIYLYENILDFRLSYNETINSLNEFERLDGYSKELWETFKNKLRNEKFYLYKIVNIFESIKKIDDKYLNYLKDYLFDRNNFDINDFVKDIKFLIDNKYEINRENLKIKNLNILKNKHYLIEKYNYPENKINIFAENFADNPIKYIELLKDKRNITKKQLDNI